MTTLRKFLTPASLLAISFSSSFFLSGCAGIGNNPSGSSSQAVTSVAVAPAGASLKMNSTQQLRATANVGNGAPMDITSTAVWISSNPSVATVGTAGLVTAIAPGTASVTASSGGQSASSAIMVNAQAASIGIAPQNGTIAAGATLQLKATAVFSDGSAADVSNTATWTSSTPAAASVNQSGLVSGATPGTAVITASLGPLSATDSIAVSASSTAAGINVTTFHFDNRRTGVNNAETGLTPQNVNPATFGKLFSQTVDGYVYAQPLYMSGLAIQGAQHNVVFVSTEKNNVYAFDADHANNNAPLWQTSLLNPGETAMPGGNPNPFQGSTSTPAIDANTNTMYVVSQQRNGKAASFRLNAMDIATGKVLKAVDVAAQVSPAHNSSSVNGVLTLSPTCQLQRSALLLDNGSIFFGFSACGSGWLLAYDEATLTQKGVLAVGPNNDGNGFFQGDGGIWMGGGGPVSDGAGNIYVATGNGPYNNASQAYGDSLLRLDSGLNLKDWFTPQDFASMQCEDQDLSGGGVVLLPNGTLVAGGKSAKVFQLDPANLGQGPHAGDTFAIATLYPGDVAGMKPFPFSCTSSDTTNPPNGQPFPTHTWNGIKTPYQLFGTPVYYNNSVYVGMTPGPVVQLALDAGGKLAPTGNFTRERVGPNSFGTTPAISANNNASAVLWFIDHGTPLESGGTATSAVLRAYDPANLGKELYNSNMTSTDQAGFGIKFSAPIVANGKVFIATANDANLAANSKGELDVYGLK